MIRTPDLLLTGDRYLTGAQVRELTGWSAQTLRRRIAAGKFPAAADFDRWSKAAVDKHFGAVESVVHEFTVNHEAIRLAVAGAVRRAARAEAKRTGRRNVENTLPGPEAPPALRLAGDDNAPAR